MFPGGFHIIVIPQQDAAKTRRFRISSFTIRLMVLGGMLAIPLIAGSFLLSVYFQNELVGSKRQLGENRQVLEEKEIIASKLSGLELSLAKLEESMGSLEQTMDMELGEIERGRGPIPEGIVLPDETASIGSDKKSIGTLLEQGDHLSLGTINTGIHDFSDRIAGLNKKIEEVYELNADKIRFMQSNPNLMPVAGWITSDFGMRKAPYSGAYKMHYGLDIASPVGTPVKAPADGKVLFAEFRGGYGRLVVLDHGYGLTTAYGHNSQIYVKEGDEVKRGTTIAAVGSTGSSTGPHLHYEVHVDGIPADPFHFVVQ